MRTECAIRKLKVVAALTKSVLVLAFRWQERIQHAGVDCAAGNSSEEFIVSDSASSQILAKVIELLAR